MDIQPIDIVIHIVNILVLYVLLRLLLYKPMRGFMDARAGAIQKDISGAQQIKADAEALKGQYAGQLKGADDEVQKRLMEGTQKASDEAGTIVDAAKAQAAELLGKAQKQAAEERGQVVSSLTPQITTMAIKLAGEILKREVSEGDNKKVIESFFEKEV